eukprot:1498753-Pleurochrysis_carterae.AAC.1
MSEWGPWVTTTETRNNPTSGCAEKVQVLTKDGSDESYIYCMICVELKVSASALSVIVLRTLLLQVKRSDSKGVQLMHHYLDVNNNPGVEAWLEPDKWSRDCVLHDVLRWQYVDADSAPE